jgi:hypothetical protein
MQHALPVTLLCAARPVPGSHQSFVHTLLSSYTVGCPARHDPAPSQVSCPLHRLPSAHDEFSGAGECVIAPVVVLQLSIVHAFPSLVDTGVPLHTPDPLQTSLWVQGFPSVQVAPASNGCLTQLLPLHTHM